jgi:hypothetical protein
MIDFGPKGAKRMALGRLLAVISSIYGQLCIRVDTMVPPNAKSHRKWLTVTAAFATLLGAQDSQGPTILTLGKTVERELFGGQSHLYRLSLAAGEYASLVVEQRGIDVVVQVLDPGGKVTTEFDSESRRNGQELVSLIADSAVNYDLRIRAKYPKDTPGRYAVRVVEVRQTTERDRSLEAKTAAGICQFPSCRKV